MFIFALAALHVYDLDKILGSQITPLHLLRSPH